MSFFSIVKENTVRSVQCSVYGEVDISNLEEGIRSGGNRPAVAEAVATAAEKAEELLPAPTSMASSLRWLGTHQLFNRGSRVRSRRSRDRQECRGRLT